MQANNGRTAEPEAETERFERYPGRSQLATLCGMMMFFYACYFGAISVLLPFIGKSFGLGAEVQGRLFPANFTGFTLGVLVCGALSDRLGRKAVLLLGIGLFAGGLLLFGLAPSFSLALFSSALIGAGSGAIEAVTSALVSDLYPDRRAVAINSIQIAFGVGATLSPAVTHSLLTDGTDWRAFYLAMTAGNVLLWAFFARQAVPNIARAPEAMDLAALRAVARHPAFLALCLCQALYVGAETTFFVWMPTYFAERLPGGARYAGYVVSLFWIMITVGRILTGKLLKRVPIMRLNLLMAAGGAAFSLLALAGTHPLFVMACTALTGLFLSGIFGLVLAEAGERFPKAAGSAFGGIVAAGGIGAALVPWAAGALSQTSLQWRGALALSPLCLALIALLSWLLARRNY